VTMTPRTRKLALVTHVGASVGWLGAVLSSLVLAVVGVASRDSALVRAIYLTLQVIGWYVLVPLSVASLLTGLVQALGTSWGLLRHYWVLVKLGMNLFATGVLLLYMQTLGALADTARTAAAGDASQLGNPSPILHAAGVVVLLLTALMLSVYKPRGLTRYGRRRAGRRPPAEAAAGNANNLHLANEPCPSSSEVRTGPRQEGIDIRTTRQPLQCNRLP